MFAQICCISVWKNTHARGFFLSFAARQPWQPCSLQSPLLLASAANAITSLARLLPCWKSKILIKETIQLYTVQIDNCHNRKVPNGVEHVRHIVRHCKAHCAPNHLIYCSLSRSVMTVGQDTKKYLFFPQDFFSFQYCTSKQMNKYNSGDGHIRARRGQGGFPLWSGMEGPFLGF